VFIFENLAQNKSFERKGDVCLGYVFGRVLQIYIEMGNFTIRLGD